MNETNDIPDTKKKTTPFVVKDFFPYATMREPYIHAHWSKKVYEDTRFIIIIFFFL